METMINRTLQDIQDLQVSPTRLYTHGNEWTLPVKPVYLVKKRYKFNLNRTFGGIKRTYG